MCWRHVRKLVVIRDGAVSHFLPHVYTSLGTPLCFDLESFCCYFLQHEQRRFLAQLLAVSRSVHAPALYYLLTYSKSCCLVCSTFPSGLLFLNGEWACLRETAAGIANCFIQLIASTASVMQFSCCSSPRDHSLRRITPFT